MTQGDPFPPTIFNVMVGAVVRHWVLLVAEGAGGQDGCCREVIRFADFFYIGDRLVASTDPYFMQGVINTLTRLFNRCGDLDQCRKDSEDALPPLQCGCQPSGCGLQAADDGRGPHLPGLTGAHQVIQ